MFGTWQTITTQRGTTHLIWLHKALLGEMQIFAGETNLKHLVFNSGSSLYVVIQGLHEFMGMLFIYLRKGKSLAEKLIFEVI